ncbi:MAG: single-stranded-DNA-specific exonuclease RecJ [Clostridia bacterium]|nr:single-stranded-DNA-specific exonuclease RecJ [Clostridia bacterium]
MEYIQNQTKFNDKKITEYSQKFNLHPEIIKLLISRGVDNFNKIDSFLNPSINQLHNPFLLRNMDKVVKRIQTAMNNKENIVILGDYDTDGISASAILYSYFKSHGVNSHVFLPNRFIDGYGMNNDTIDKIISTYSPQLIITVDCGIASYKEVEHCKSKGVEIIVTDHHDIPEIVPDTLVIDPKLNNQDYPFKELCGAGVALKLVQALSGVSEALKYTTIASIATVADIVPLVDENRFIVHHGLENQENNLPIGIKKLCKKTKINLPISSQDIAYKLAPKINASGRMGDATISFNLYVSNDDKDLAENISKLLNLNDDRLENTNIITDDAFDMLKNINVTNLGIIVLCKDNWESGVLGIICAKLVEKYNKPVCLLTNVEGEYKGSCRSIPGINIYEALSSVSDLLIRFGGHNQAGGLSLYKENVAEFTRRINEFILNKYPKSAFIPTKTYDIDANKVNINLDFLNQLERLNPFGFGNETPTYKLSCTNCTVMRLPNHPNHLKIKYNDMEVVCFGAGDMYYNFSSNTRKDMLLDISAERFGKTVRILGKLKSVNFNKLNGAIRKDVLCANYLYQLQYLNTKNDAMQIHIDPKTAIGRISELVSTNPTGTLIICNTSDSYEKICRKLPQIKNYELYSIKHSMGENTILLSPNSEENFINYSNIIFMDTPLCTGYINHVAQDGSQIYVVDGKFNNNLFNSLDSSRHVFGIYHNIIKDYVNKNIQSIDLPNVFKNIKKLNPQNSYLNYSQFYFVASVLSELGIINIDGGKITYDSSVNSKLTNSTIYNFVSQFKNFKD